MLEQRDHSFTPHYVGIFEIFDDNARREANTKILHYNQKAPNEVALETREYLFGHKISF